jgi:hypothetical protein
MRVSRYFRMSRALWAVLLLAPLCGCGFSGGSAATMPTVENGRKAIEVALSAWKAGKKPEPIQDSDPKIGGIIDRDWQTGEQLTSFEVLREESSSPEKKFVVKLALAKASAPKEVNYVVIGTGPCFVFREEDYAQSINMDAGAPSGKKAAEPIRKVRTR